MFIVYYCFSENLKEIGKMSKDLKALQTEVSKECWKKLKKISIDREISLPMLVREILEKMVTLKKYDTSEQSIIQES